MTGLICPHEELRDGCVWFCVVAEIHCVILCKIMTAKHLIKSWGSSCHTEDWVTFKVKDKGEKKEAEEQQSNNTKITPKPTSI